MVEPGTLIKFGRLEHLLQLQSEGLLYMNDLPYFWKVEDEDRGDPFDCIAEVQRGPKVGFALPDGKEVFMEGEWAVRMHPPEHEKINLFCMYALRPLVEGTFPVDRRNFRLGEHALLFINPSEFMRRIELSLKSQKVIANADLVEYVDDKHVGKLGPFKKLKKFSHQSEWRLVCYNGPGKPREIRIGGIQDISVIMRSENVNKEITVTFEDFEQDTEPERP
jgi:hypothetical protein